MSFPSRPAGTGRSSFRQIAKAMDQPPELIPARYSALRARPRASYIMRLLNRTAKTLENHKSNAKAALLWFSKEKDVLPHGVLLSPAWDRLRAQVTDPSTRYRLMPLMRFCSRVPDRARGGQRGGCRSLYGSSGTDNCPRQ